MRLPEAQDSRAVLIGVSEFSMLDSLPAVSNNLNDLASCFRDEEVWGLPEKNCIVVPDPRTHHDVGRAVDLAAGQAVDTLVVYYSGHGLVDTRTFELLLALPETVTGKLHTAIPYEWLRRVVLESAATHRIVILDCCYSGRALGTMSDSTTVVADYARIEGTFVLAAAPENSPALAPPGDPHTAFTGALIDLLRNGKKDGPEFLDLDMIFEDLKAKMQARALPLPQKRVRNDGGKIPFVRNRAWRRSSPPHDLQMTARSNEALAALLRELRLARFPGATISQRALGRALGASESISAPLISSWEKGIAIPSRRWLDAYALFFCTPRSVVEQPYRLLDDSELTADERAERDRLRQTLQSVRHDESRSTQTHAPTALGGLWQFRDGNPVRIICGEVPDRRQERLIDTAPLDATYGEFYTFSDADALVELFGHLRAANPHSDVRIMRYAWLTPDDFSAHLVLLGNVELNMMVARVPQLLPDFPLQKITEDPGTAAFEVEINGEPQRFSPKVGADGELLTDVGFFLRAVNPFNRKRTLTILSAIYSSGVFGVVRALTDVRFAERNEDYMRQRFKHHDGFGILMRILIVNGYEVLTPDWTIQDVRLHEWPEHASGKFA